MRRLMFLTTIRSGLVIETGSLSVSSRSNYFYILSYFTWDTRFANLELNRSFLLPRLCSVSPRVQLISDSRILIHNLKMLLSPIALVHWQKNIDSEGSGTIPNRPDEGRLQRWWSVGKCAVMQQRKVVDQGLCCFRLEFWYEQNSMWVYQWQRGESGEVVRDTIFMWGGWGKDTKSQILKVRRQYPLVLLVEVTHMIVITFYVTFEGASLKWNFI
jgi:hypothetical protein